MAIAAIYPSRRQSRWSNPLFRRPMLRKVRRIAVFALMAVTAGIGGFLFLKQAEPQISSAPEMALLTLDATLAAHGKSSAVRTHARPENSEISRSLPGNG